MTPDDQTLQTQPGTLRDELAVGAMNAIIANSTGKEDDPGLPFRVWKWVGAKHWSDSKEDARDPANWALHTDAIARLAYQMADSMLAERVKKKGRG